jgi:predicted anti-sigma-YlaC factor YlaD
MSHLTPDQLVDALDETASVDLRRHLESCPSCRACVDELTDALTSAQDLDVPEPSPLFWGHLSARVRSAVEAEGSPDQGWRRWLRLPVLAPLAGLALVIAALIVTLPNAIRPLPIEVAEVPSGDVPLNDDGWTLVADAVGDLDWDTAMAAGLRVEPGAIDRAIMDLSADEQRELTAILHAELRAKS